MRKIISKGEYTLFFEEKNEDVDCVAYKTGRHMKINDISEVIGITRVSVRNNLRKAVLKMYKKMKENNIESIDAILSMALVFNISSIEEYKTLLGLFPKEIREEIYQR